MRFLIIEDDKGFYYYLYFAERQEIYLRINMNLIMLRKYIVYYYCVILITQTLCIYNFLLSVCVYHALKKRFMNEKIINKS